MARKAPRTKNKDNARRSKKKTSVLTQERVDYVDYKDVNLLHQERAREGVAALHDTSRVAALGRSRRPRS
jgi:ribosomal protein S18